MVRGDESDLQILQEEWDKVAIQTGWRIEPMLQFEYFTAVSGEGSADVGLDSLARESTIVLTK